MSRSRLKQDRLMLAKRLSTAPPPLLWRQERQYGDDLLQRWSGARPQTVRGSGGVAGLLADPVRETVVARALACIELRRWRHEP